MQNLYAGLDDLQQAMKGGTSATDKAVALRVVEACSRSADRGLEWQFFNEVAQTAYFDGNGRRVLRLRSAAVERGFRRAALLALTSVAVDEDDDGTYELALVENTDVWLTDRENDGPYRALELMTRSTLASAWHRAPRSVKVVGEFGYSNETEAAGTLGAAITDAAATSITMASGHTVQAGNTMVVGSEQIFVGAVSGTALSSCVRGVNGSTAATHSNGAAVRRRRYPRPVEQLVTMEAARLIRDGLTGFSGSVGNAEFAGYAFQAMYPAIADLKRSFHPTGMAVVH